MNIFHRGVFLPRVRLHGLLAVVSVPLLAIGLVFAEGTRTWEQSKFEDFTKGTANGVAIFSAGELELAPSFKWLTTTPSTYIWSIATDSAGTLYAATGAPARVYRVTPDGKSSVIFEAPELGIQALAVDKSGAIYAATNPDGKVYRLEKRPAKGDVKSETKPGVDPSWSSSTYFEPKTKYIWDLKFNAAGDLFVATGDHGDLFRVKPNGEHSVFFKSDEAHIRVLALDPKGDVVAGSDGSGLIYRISPTGEGFVLYSAPKKEITALAIDASGNIYAAGSGEKRPGGLPIPPAPPTPVVTPQPNPAINQSPLTGGPVAPSPAPIVMGSFPPIGVGTAGGSEIYRIAPDGSPTRVWSSREELVYALAFDNRGRLLAGTGNRGHIFAISAEDRFSDLVKASASQVTAFAQAPGGGFYASTSNLGKLFLLGAAPDSEGTYESDVFDARIFSRWGRLEFRGLGDVELFARSGNVDNPDRNWSPWQKVDRQKDGVISAPAARFIQWKAVFHVGNPSPRLDSVTVNYLPKNVAPDFEDVTVQSGVRYQSLPKPDVSGGQQQRFDVPPPSIHDSDSIGVKWSVRDDNDDQMVYSVYYHGDGETRWLPLKSYLTDKFFSFDASLLPDGGYVIKVVASDAPSHSPGQALTAEREGPRFEVDTTPPTIDGLKAVVEGGKVHAAFRAVDGYSTIKRAECSLDAGDWQYIDPVDQLSDSKSENYDFLVTVPQETGPAMLTAPEASAVRDASVRTIDHVIVVRVYDRYDNMNSAKVVVRGK